MGLAGEIRTGIQQRLEGGCRRLGRRMAGEPFGATAGALMVGDIKYVLGAKLETGERPRRRACERHMGFAAKCSESFLQDIRLHGLSFAFPFDVFRRASRWAI